MAGPGAPEVEAAAQLIGDRVRVTPVLEAAGSTFALPGPVVLKLEQLQHSGSFKARGAFTRVLSAAVPAAGVVAASGGNHGLAVAHVARELGVPAEVFVPRSSSPVKVARLRGYGATVRVGGDYYADAYAASQVRAAETRALQVHAYDAPEVLAGQGTLARELERQCPELDTVVVAVGGGGLLGGVATWYAGRVRVVAVEPERCPTLSAALAAGEPVDVEVGGLAADSLGARRIGTLGLAAAHDADVRSVLVPDTAIADARQRLWDELRIVSEPGGAAALAALTSGAYRPRPGERVAVVLCGGNTDPRDLVPEG